MKGESVESAPISHADIEAAKRRLIVEAQASFFGDEIRDLREGRRVKPHSSIRRLRPVLEGDLLLGSPRTGEPALTLIPHGSHLAKLIIWDMHRRYLHAGTDWIITAVHRRFWITQLCKLVKSQFRLLTSLSC